MVEIKKPLLYKTLKILLKSPIIILMVGEWRTGKTDTSLLIAHLCLKWGLVDKVGSNIKTNDPRVEYIITTGKLRKWLHADKAVKLFLFDEALKHVYRRLAMTSKNISIIQLLPELSKGHARVIVISQNPKVDTDLIDPVFCRAKWEKLAKKVMRCTSKHHRPRTFKNLPKSPIRFDPDTLALFFDKDMSKMLDLKEKSVTYQIALSYGSGLSFPQIKRETGLHQEQIRREIRKALNLLCKLIREFPEEFKGEL